LSSGILGSREEKEEGVKKFEIASTQASIDFFVSS
jgi:hypothetical protein